MALQHRKAAFDQGAIKIPLQSCGPLAQIAVTSHARRRGQITDAKLATTLHRP